MTTFDQTSRLERIALIARAMEIDTTGYVYDPYVDSYQSQDVQETLQIKTDFDDGMAIAEVKGSYQEVTAETLRDSIGDCAARWQWERERAAKPSEAQQFGNDLWSGMKP